MNTVFLVIVSCFWTSFCFPNTYLHRTEEANYPIASFNKMKREFDSIGPLASSAENPFTALIVAGGVNNSIYHVCSGSILNTPTSNLTKEFNLQTSFILTTTYCILDRKDRDVPDGTKNLVYKVLINDPAGTIQLLGQNFTVFNLSARLFNPNVNTIKNYSVNVSTPLAAGASQIQNISVNVNDIGLIQLTTFIDIPGVQATVIKRPSNLQPGDPVSVLGYGRPNFFELRKTDRTKLIYAQDLQNQQPSSDMLFFHDGITELSSTTPTTPIQAIEAGDEGGPIVNAANEQIGIAQATWRAQIDNATVITFASIGLSTEFYYPYIASVLSTRNTTTVTQPPPVGIQSSAHLILPSFLFYVAVFFLSSII